MRQTMLAFGLLVAFGPNIPNRHNFNPIPVAHECHLDWNCLKQCQADNGKDCRRVCERCS